MGLFDFLRRGDERAIPDPESPEFRRMVEGSALPGSEGLEMGQPGWSSVGGATPAEEVAAAASDASHPAGESARAPSEDGTGSPPAGEIQAEVERVLREHGVDPDDAGRVDASKVPGLQRALGAVLRGAGVNIPGLDGSGTTVAGGPGGFRVSEPADPSEQLEALDRAHAEGRITAAELEAQRRRLRDG